MCALVTGVQTCALPFSSSDLESLRCAFQSRLRPFRAAFLLRRRLRLEIAEALAFVRKGPRPGYSALPVGLHFREGEARPRIARPNHCRSEERRVGKECGSPCRIRWDLSN